MPIVVLEGAEAKEGEAPREAGAQRRALAVVVVEAELLVDEVPEEPELLFGEVGVVVSGAEQRLHRIPGESLSGG